MWKLQCLLYNCCIMVIIWELPKIHRCDKQPLFWSWIDTLSNSGSKTNSCGNPLALPALLHLEPSEYSCEWCYPKQFVCENILWNLFKRFAGIKVDNIPLWSARWGWICLLSEFLLLLLISYNFLSLDPSSKMFVIFFVFVSSANAVILFSSPSSKSFTNVLKCKEPKMGCVAQGTTQHSSRS